MLIFIITAAQASQPDAIELLDAENRLNGQAPLSRETASVVLGHAAESGRRTLRWQRLSGETVAERTGDADSTRLCSRLSGRDPIPGPRRLLIDIGGVASDPMMLLVSGLHGEEVRVSLAPGEQILSVFATTPRGDAVEYLELNQNGGQLTLLREGRDSMVCYDSGEPQP